MQVESLEQRWLLSLDPGIGGEPPADFRVIRTSPSDRSCLPAWPVAVEIQFSEEVDVNTLVASDLQINGQASNSWEQMAADTIAFYPALWREGAYVLEIASGSILSTQATPIAAFAFEIEIDSTPPWVTVNALTTTELSPALSGQVNDPLAEVYVTVRYETYAAVNHGDGTWTLPAGTIDVTDGIDVPGDLAAVFSEDVQVSAVDRAGNVGYDTTLYELEIRPLGAIRGMSWDDLDGDRSLDPSEPVLPGVTIYLDLNENEGFDPGEPSAVTDDAGNYEFAGVLEGTYQVAEVLPEDWQQTCPCVESWSSEGTERSVIIISGPGDSHLYPEGVPIAHYRAQVDPCLAIEGANFGSRRTPLEITGRSLQNFDTIHASPSDFTIEFGEAVDPATVSREGLVIDGAPALDAELVDGNTVRFAMPPLANGMHLLSMAAGNIAAPSGRSNAPLEIWFTVDTAAPNAQSDAYPLDEGCQLSVPWQRGVLDNDTDASRPLTTRLVQPPLHGSLALASNGSFTYQPAAGFFGEDSFTYRASDGYLESEPATVYLMVTRPLGQIDSLELPSEDPTLAKRWYRFSTANPGFLTVQAVGSGTELLLLDEHWSPVAFHAGADGRSRVDSMASAHEVFYLGLAGIGGEVDLRWTNLVDVQGPTVLVRGSARDEDLVVDLSKNQLVINDTEYVFNSIGPRIQCDGGGGRNTATLVGTEGDETVRLQPDGGVFRGPGFEVTLWHTATILACGEGGRDMAYLEDSPRSDRFDATPSAARLFGKGFNNRVRGFETVEASSTAGGQDLAYLTDSPHNDTLEAWPDSARLYGRGFDNRAAGFSQVTATATGGRDIAYLYGSEDVDTLVATPTSATLSSTRYRNQANGFDIVQATATRGGKDLAWLYDSPGNDQFDALPETARMFGPGFYNRALAFDFVHGMSTAGGYDVANLYDSPRNDAFLATPDCARMFGPGFYNRARYFEEVRAYSTAGGVDVAKLTGAKYVDRVLGNTILEHLVPNPSEPNRPLELRGFRMLKSRFVGPGSKGPKDWIVEGCW